ncbi:hypothetical protein BRADI_5g24180v3 [Brachypodium distachyon]|uniref:Protein kinase domain-containing protein n=1 Tax=Brachypodium distachyon TaxID=15368 RepID=A0A0Q3H9X9_BRADI|nr:hypothetical protein BRADI_5g24180v3 [Brachypodium distachyon]PNT62017.1 hypothetical protein BRADI_5g24180v3 [Brachypodium distachyon]
MVLFASTPSTKAKLGTIVAALELSLIVTILAAPVALPGCPEACGNITVPYPFGIRQGCSRPGFNLTCDETRHPPKLFLGHGVEVDAISLADGTMRVQSKIVIVTTRDFNGSWSSGIMPNATISVSTEHNVFAVLRSNVIAHLAPSYNVSEQLYNSTCAALCDDYIYWTGTVWAWDRDAPCSGVACCHTTIASGLPAYGVQFKDFSQKSYPVSDEVAFREDTPFSFAAAIVDSNWFSGNVGLMFNNTYNNVHHGEVTVVPTVLDWWLEPRRDDDILFLDPNISIWRCISLNSVVNFVNNDVRKVQSRCSCLDGYEGNPYIVNGCQDIDECQQPDVYSCVHGTCINMPGTYRCLSKKSIISLPGLITVIAISAGLGLLFSVLGAAKITKKLKQQRAKKLRQKFFKKNHGLLLQQLISSNKDIAERTRIFSWEELEQATNKFDNNRILGGGGHGTVYKGILSDQRVVAIKKAKIVVQRKIDQFINEVVILSQTNHRNVVKLFGCCLETEVPLLVYEFISNGTLSFHLHGQSENPLTWTDRLRIALETARAIVYLHSAASISVYHRDIKCANILLADTLTAKVSDFGASRSIAIDETGILTAVQGTYGYLDPEYYYTSRLTEKSDVYSFGVILAELVTRVTPVFSSHSSEEACLSLKGEERPTMRQVEISLEDVKSSKVHHNSQTTRVSQDALTDQSCKGNKVGEGTRLYSLEKEFIQSSEIPR